MRRISWVITCLALCCVFASSLWAAQPDLAAADWSVKSTHSLATNPPSDDAVLGLLSKLITLGAYSGICSSRFADLRHSGNLSLVVSVTDGRFCSLSIIDKTPSGFERYAADQAHFSDGPKIEDLAGNGNLELIVDTEFTGYLGGTGPCVATWPVIYAWTGTGYTDVSNQYKGYYEQQLQSLKKEIAAVSSATAAASSPAASTAAARHEDDCAEAEAAKIERFLGISRDAGMTEAIKWADSDNPYTREFAADVLTDIGTPDAVENLRTLSNDTDKPVTATDESVAAVAKRDLEAAGRGPALNTIDRQKVEQPLSESPPK